jgi:predicted nucleic acid-binding protein
VIVVDTCVWIEALIGSKTGARYLPLWDAPENIIVPTLIQFELRKWCERNVGEDVALNAISATRRCIVQPLTEKIALDAAEMSAKHNLAALDALIYATALNADATLVTCDAHFRGLVGVEFVAK